MGTSMEKVIEESGEALASDMRASAAEAAALLKALSHENRLMILCLLAEGEKAVTELEQALGMRQPAVSQQLARLRGEGLVEACRQGKAIFYSIASEEARQVIELLYALYCAPKKD